MRTRLTQKQETFCVKYFELGNATEAALIAGYSSKNARAIASINLTKVDIQARLQELRQKVEDASVMNVLERKQRLTEISRAKLTDFQTAGADGSWIDIGPENPHSGALQEITSRTEYDDKGASAAVITRIKLNDPVKAIDLLNKMDKLYSDGAIFQDNRVARQVNIYVIDNETKALISQVAKRVALTNGNANDKGLQSDSGSMGGGEEGNTT